MKKHVGFLRIAMAAALGTTLSACELFKTKSGNCSGSFGAFKTLSDCNESAPTIVSISPASGHESGGSTVTLAGTKFFSGATVKIGSVACDSVTIVAETSATCKTGKATAQGATDVVLTNSDGQTGTLSGGFTYYGTLAIAPSAFTLAVNNSITFTASGGMPTYSYALGSGVGSIAASTGIYTAPSTLSGSSESAVIRATDSVGNTSDGTLTILPAIALSPSSVTVAGVATTSFTVTGGVAPFTCSLSSGTGSVAASSASVCAYTSTGGAGSSVVQVKDALGNTATATVTGNSTLAISPASRATVVNKSITFSVSGGVSPFTFSQVSGGGTINASSGVYVTAAAAETAVVRVTDSAGSSSNSTLDVRVALAASPGSYTLAVNRSFTLAGSSGVAPYTYSLASGTGSIDASTGVYVAPASSGAAVARVTDSDSNTADCSVTVNSALAISPASVTVAAGNSITFAGSGGVPAYAYSQTTGSSAINASTGVFTAAASAGTSVIQVADAQGYTVSATVTINSALSLSPSSFTLAVGNTKQFTASGGVGSVTYQVQSGLGSINGATGSYTAGASAGTVVLQAVDSLANAAQATVLVNAALATGAKAGVPTVGLGGTSTITGSAGVPPYSFTVTSGSGSVNASSGVFTAPTSAGTTVIQVTDAMGNTSSVTMTTASVSLVAANGDQNTSCAVFTNGMAKCWGRNSSGQLGYGDTLDRGDSPGEMGENLPFINVGTGRTIRKIVLGSLGSTCAILDNQTIKCWGYADSSTPQLGIADADSRGDAPGEMGDSLPVVQLGTGRTVQQVASSYGSYCALLDNGTVKCWGYGTNGQLGKGNESSIGGSVGQMGDNLSALDLGTGLLATAIGGYDQGSSYCAVLDNGTLKCWGSGNSGGTGYEDTRARGDGAGEMGDSLPAVSLGTGFTPVTVAGRSGFNCVVNTGRTMKCFGLGTIWGSGYNDTKTRGDGTGEMGDSLPLIDYGAGRTLKTAASYAVGYDHVCAILDNDQLKCWGALNYGELGQGASVYGNVGDSASEMGDNLAAVSLGAGRTAVQVVTGVRHTCVLLDNGRVKCFGTSIVGEGGYGDTTDRGDATGEMGDCLPYVDL